MRERVPQTIDMTPAGEFVQTGARPSLLPNNWPLRIGIAAAIIATLAGAVTLAALFLWIASLLLPVAFIAGIVAYGAFRYQRWRSRR